MNDGERDVMDSLVMAWNCFVKLHQTHPDDITDFRQSIHECQRILAVRQLRRTEPDVWPTR